MRTLVFAVAGLILASFGVSYAFSKKAANDRPVSSSNSSSIVNDELIWILKADGGKQCETGTAQSIEQGSDELKKAQISVIESTKNDDGMMRVQMCGAPAGKQNAYRIRKTDLPKALALGFREAGASMDKKH